MIDPNNNDPFAKTAEAMREAFKGRSVTPEERYKTVYEGLKDFAPTEPVTSVSSAATVETTTNFEPTTTPIATARIEGANRASISSATLPGVSVELPQPPHA